MNTKELKNLLERERKKKEQEEEAGIEKVNPKERNLRNRNERKKVERFIHQTKNLRPPRSFPSL